VDEREEGGNMPAEIQYVSDAEGNPVGVLVPIDLWREIASERETAYLLKSEAMRQRLLEAKNRTEGISLEAARAQLGV
jgi:hypothetical protein